MPPGLAEPWVWLRWAAGACVGGGPSGCGALPTGAVGVAVVAEGPEVVCAVVVAVADVVDVGCGLAAEDAGVSVAVEDNCADASPVGWELGRSGAVPGHRVCPVIGAARCDRGGWMGAPIVR